MRYWILLAVMTLSGCGQKGALYLPKETQSPQTEAVSTETGQTQG